MILSDLEIYEIKAEAFRILTGNMAPGKDVAPAANGKSFDERFALWGNWMRENKDVTNAMIKAMERVC